MKKVIFFNTAMVVALFFISLRYFFHTINDSQFQTSMMASLIVFLILRRVFKVSYFR
jgi:hypothetical protein